MRAIAYPFTITSTGKIVVTSDISKMYLDRALTLVSTLIRQRFMRPSYGVDLGKGMFENANSYVDGLDSAIRQAMATWLTELSILELKIDEATEFGTVEITMIMALPNSTNIELTFKTVIISPDGSAEYQRSY